MTKDLPDTPTGVKLSEFIGQEKIISDIKKRIEFAKLNGKHFPNIILSGPMEMGKNTLAGSIPRELEVLTKYASAKDIEKIGDLASLLTNLAPNDVIVLDNISDLKKDLAKEFYRAIESGEVQVAIGKGLSHRKLLFNLPPFSVITTTSKPWQIDEKIRRWFVIYDFASYSQENLRDIFIKLAIENGFKVDLKTAEIFVPYCNGSPGNVSVLVRRIAGYLYAISSKMSVQSPRSTEELSELEKIKKDSEAQGYQWNKTDSVKIISKTPEVNSENISEILSYLGFGENYPRSLSLVDKFAHMSGTDFEQWVADYFRKDGYEVKMTKTTGDHGIDLELYKLNKLVAVVQCKNWDGTVGEPTVRDFYGSLMSVKASEGYIFAPTSFTQQARDFAQDKPIKLVDLEELIKLAE